jgi:NAD(P)-dependent dehydrogenase (short-subunit alcohol dehydrogenase family)
VGPVSGAPSGLLAGRLAVVTGGGSGLGAAIARRLAEAGATGIVIDQSFPAVPGLAGSAAPAVPEASRPGPAVPGLAGSAAPAVPEASRPGPAVPGMAGWTSAVADVRDPAALAAAFDQAAGAAPQVVVACAGIVPPWTSTADIDAGQWEDVFAVNVRGVMLTIREAVRRMGDGGGSIVAISSLNGWKGDPHLPSYTASKHAVVGLVRSAALDVGPRGIRVNAVAPGPIATPALRARMASRAGPLGLPVAEALRQAASLTALRRIATETEVADAVLFLASDMSSGITGQLLAVDAGLA